MLEVDRVLRKPQQDILQKNLPPLCHGALYTVLDAIIPRIYADAGTRQAEEYLYTVWTAELLNDLHSDGVIAGWSYVPRYSALDGLLIDFVVIRTNMTVIGVNSTASTRLAERHRQAMRQMYPHSTDENPAIAVLRWRAKTGDDRDRNAVRNELTSLIDAAQPLARFLDER